MSTEHTLQAYEDALDIAEEACRQMRYSIALLRKGGRYAPQQDNLEYYAHRLKSAGRLAFSIQREPRHETSASRDGV